MYFIGQSIENRETIPFLGEKKVIEQTNDFHVIVKKLRVG